MLDLCPCLPRYIESQALLQRRVLRLSKIACHGARRADSSVAGSGASPPVDRPARSRSTGSWSPRKFVRRHFPPGDAANGLKKPKLHNVKRS